MGIKAIVIHFPKSLFLSLAFLLEKLGDLFKFSPLINSTRAKSMTSNRIYDISKIKKLGYKQESEFASSMRLTINWYKENGYI